MIIEINKYIVNENPRKMQSLIKKHSGETLPKFLIGLFLLLVVENWLPDIIALSCPTTIADVIANLNPGLSAQAVSALPNIPVILYVYAMLLNGVFKLGETLYCLTYIRNREIDYKALYEGISLYFKALGLYLLQMLIISFWSMFFIIPGIIAALNFSQAFYIFADNPEKGILASLLESKLRMRGNRINYIKMLISYIPYILLGLIPSLAIGYFFNIDTTTMNGIAIELAVNATFYTALAYTALGQCTFYELLINNGYSNFKYRGQSIFRDHNLSEIKEPND